ncbi:MAG: heavy-metal-associated domain-containing protein [Chitinophagales bacterium]
MKKIYALFVLVVFTFLSVYANKTLNLSVKGMHCGGCEMKFKSAASDIEGIKEVSSVSASNSNAVIIYDEKTTTEEKVIKALAEQTGYTVSAVSGTTTATGKPAGCCMSGQSNPSCKDKDKAKCAKTKCDKPKTE